MENKKRWGTILTVLAWSIIGLLPLIQIFCYWTVYYNLTFQNLLVLIVAAMTIVGSLAGEKGKKITGRIWVVASGICCLIVVVSAILNQPQIAEAATNIAIVGLITDRILGMGYETKKQPS